LTGDRYLQPLTVFFLGTTLFLLGFRARSRRGYGPLAAGAIGAAVIVWGKFHLGSNAVANAGTFILAAAAIVNAWPRRTRQEGSP